MQCLPGQLCAGAGNRRNTAGGTGGPLDRIVLRNVLRRCGLRWVRLSVARAGSVDRALQHHRHSEQHAMGVVAGRYLLLGRHCVRGLDDRWTLVRVRVRTRVPWFPVLLQLSCVAVLQLSSSSFPFSTHVRFVVTSWFRSTGRGLFHVHIHGSCSAQHRRYEQGQHDQR